MTNTAVTETAAEPDWAKYGLQAQQPSMAEAERAYDYEQETDSEENDLFKEQQKTDEKPWWKANFFISEPVLFGAWDGVFTSCMLNIFGVIIFLRTGWMVGNAGVGLSMLIIFITLTVASIGAMSAIGICERCKIERGGVYFLLSHVLGGQMASAVGILYCFGQAVSCSLYTIGFGESISDLLNMTENKWVARGFAIGALLLLTGINVAGVKWVIRLQLVLLFTIMVAAVDFLVGSFISYGPGDGVIGFSYHLLRNNTSPDYAFGESFFTVFGVFFPTACGVLAGINMSGDLRNPRKAIAQGTIAATFLSGSFYVIFVLILGSMVERWALKSDYMVSEKVSALGVLWLIGLYVSSITSCMGGLYGAPRVLQSIASGNNFSAPLSYLSIGRGANKVPVVALTVVGLTSLIFICVGDLNFLAPIVTMPFLITYISVDYAYFALAMTADLDTNNNKPIPAPRRNTSQKSFGSQTSHGYGSLENSEDVNRKDDDRPPDYEMSAVTQQHPSEEAEEDDTDNDLDHLFPEERKFSHSVQSGQQCPDATSAAGEKQNLNTNNSATKTSDNEDEKGPLEPQKIYKMKPSWYSKFCNRWFSIFGAFMTFAIMFATQWLYALVALTALALLYLYLVYTIPGAHPGIAKFSMIGWIRSSCQKQHDDYHGHIIVNQHSPLLTTTEAQLNEDNEDFSQRKPYHQSELRPGEELPLLCDEDK